jgi:polyphosphate kinase 2 (PPK2 family)
LSQKIEFEKYDKLLKNQQSRISAAMTKCHKNSVTNIIVLEGWDAAGKGGVVRRLIYAMDAQFYEVTNTAAPTDEEMRYHYLRRFWKNLPPRGHCKIFDRSWYGRVLVERVEGFAAETEWERAFSEIVQFERQLTQNNVILHKFWLHISPDEQIRRFHKRESITYKNYKITQEDYRNRGKWDYYKCAVQDMIIRTSTPDAPWRIIAAEDKKFARVHVLKHIADRIEDFFSA